MSFVKPHEGGRESHAHEHAQHPPCPLPDITSISKPSFLVFRIPIMLISIPFMLILSSPFPLPLLMPIPVHAWLLTILTSPIPSTNAPKVTSGTPKRGGCCCRHHPPICCHIPVPFKWRRLRCPSPRRRRRRWGSGGDERKA